MVRKRRISDERRDGRVEGRETRLSGAKSSTLFIRSRFGYEGSTGQTRTNIISGVRWEDGRPTGILIGGRRVRSDRDYNASSGPGGSWDLSR